MHIKLFKVLLFLGSVSINQVVQANQFFDPLDGQFDASQYLSENAYGFLPVPIIITDPALGGGLGMTGIFFHETEAEKNTRLEAMKSSENAAANLLPPSVSAVAGLYTGNNSYFVGGGHLGFFNGGDIRYMGGGGYGNFNLDFYGFGDISLNKPLELNTSAVMVMQNVKFKVAESNFFIGIAQRYISADLQPTKLDEIVGVFPPDWQDKIAKLFTSSISTSGLGITIDYDNRDNFFSPKSGYFYQLNHLIYDDAIGSDINYQLTEFSGLNYIKLTNKWRTGIRLAFNYADSDELLPPYALPSLSLRGVPSGRYQGNAVAVTELELVYQVSLRWQVNLFGGVGRVASDISGLKDDSSKVSKGVGFRYLMARRYGFDMGIDIAHGPEDTVFYIQAGSAW